MRQFYVEGSVTLTLTATLFTCILINIWRCTKQNKQNTQTEFDKLYCGNQFRIMIDANYVKLIASDRFIFTETAQTEGQSRTSALKRQGERRRGPQLVVAQSQ